MGTPTGHFSTHTTLPTLCGPRSCEWWCSPNPDRRELLITNSVLTLPIYRYRCKFRFAILSDNISESPHNLQGWQKRNPYRGTSPWRKRGQN